MLFGMSLTFYSSVAKSNKVIKLRGLIPTGTNSRKTGRVRSGPYFPLSWTELRKPDT